MIDPIALTRTLVEIQSPTGEEAPAVDAMATVLEGLGWTVRRQEVTPGRHNLYATRGSPVVVFSTHLDCVPPYVPFREDADTLYGRGTCDAKGLAAAMVAAAERLHADGEDRIGLLFVVGEETRSDGARATVSLEPRGRYLINGEPTDGLLCIGQKGTLGVLVEARGRAAHSGYPEEGTSAVIPLLETLRRIRRMPLPYDPALGPATLNIGVVRAGSAPNVIPGEAMAHLLIRTVGDTADLRQRLAEQAEAGVTISFPHEIPAWRGEGRPGWDTTIVRFASDLPSLEAWGTRFQLGPGSIRNAHTADERIGKAELLAGVDAYVRLAKELLAEG